MELRRANLIFAASFLAALLSTGCGGHSQDNQQRVTTDGRTQADGSSSPAAPSTGTDDRPVIVAFGDSLTAGVVENTYPQYLQELLDKNRYRYRVDNQGVSGDTTTDGLARVENVVAAHPVLVILEFGGNDGLRGLPVEETQGNLAGLIKRLQAAQLPVVLAGITLPPNYGADYVKAFTTMYPSLARQYHLRLIPFLLLNVYQHGGMMQPDGIHPNGEGNRIVARDVFNFIKPLLTPEQAAHG